MFVYVIEKGESGEGGFVEHVTKRLDKARKLVRTISANFGPWIQDQDDKMLYNSGCDYVRITRHAVQ